MYYPFYCFYFSLQIAEEELAEFELLEKVALDTSISSNASSVLRLVAANKSNIAHHNTSSPIPKGIKFNQGKINVLDAYNCIYRLFSKLLYQFMCREMLNKPWSFAQKVLH